MAPLDTVHTAETPEGIALALRPAGVVARSWALAIDLAIRFAVLAAAAGLFALGGQLGWGLFLLLWFVLEWFYPVLFELLPGSATPGKRALGLKVVMDSGLPVTPAGSLLRNLLRAADFLPAGYALGAMSVLLRSDFKRLGDLAAGTLVVHTESASLGGPLPEVEAQAPSRPLSPRQQAAVLAWAGRSPRLTDARVCELAEIARPVLGSAAGDPQAARARLLGIARWVWGHR